MRRCVAFFFVILGLSISEKALDAASAPARTIIAHAAVNAGVLPLWAAKEQGFFSKYGVPSEMIFIRQAPTLVAAYGDCALSGWRSSIGVYWAVP